MGQLGQQLLTDTGKIWRVWVGAKKNMESWVGAEKNMESWVGAGKNLESWVGTKKKLVSCSGHNAPLCGNLEEVFNFPGPWHFQTQQPLLSTVKIFLHFNLGAFNIFHLYQYFTYLQVVLFLKI
jgi:hypothetical protein